MKDKNLKNLKIICHLYKSIYDYELSLENVSHLNLNKNHNNLTTLLELNLNIITELEYLKRIYINITYFNIFQNLITSYFNFISLINCFTPSASRHLSLTAFDKRFSHFFNIVPSSYNIDAFDNITDDLLRNISLESINYFFNYSLTANKISDEFCEVFFPNSPENKFYQYFFKSLDNYFKIRILNKNGLVFYIYKSTSNSIDTISTSLSKEEAKNFTDIYLKEKFKDAFYNLLFDNSYLNTSYYMNKLESYKLKYNYKDFNSSKSLYVTVDTNFNTVQEIALF
ncbi:hypothetical protein [Romboutsia sp.]|uniref:hypothetical protein n=1 Tax=Romboutsia sp. TaxID=1965302 RepID=UPI003F330FD6